MSKIDRFDGDYEFLSNFHIAPIIHNGKQYKTTEHFFQAHKAKTEEDHEKIREVPGPGSAKRLGQKVDLVDEWEELKDSVMLLALLCKFTQHTYLMEKLMLTDGVELEEGNNWDDKYWGTVNGEGQNKLGKLLMYVRDTLLLRGVAL